MQLPGIIPSSDYYILPTAGRKVYNNPNEFNNLNLNQAKIKIVIKLAAVGDFRVLIEVLLTSLTPRSIFQAEIRIEAPIFGQILDGNFQKTTTRNNIIT